MMNNALSIANHFIQLAKDENMDITQLGLMKRVYIAYGFCLAMLNKSVFDDRFDRVEAWRYGPVVPSVYNSFKHYKNRPIEEQTVIMEWCEKEQKANYITPKLNDKEVMDVVGFVWDRYKNLSDSSLVTITHKAGSPWELSYVPNMNTIIPESFTKLYYQKLIQNIIDVNN